MNLHSLASGCINAINPSQRVAIQKSDGYSTGADGGQVPKYEPTYDAIAQVQDLSEKDLAQLEGLNIQNSMRSMYISRELNGVVRLTQKGGDIITTVDDKVWLTTQVLEQWYEGGQPVWCKVACTLQMDAGSNP